MVGGGLLAGCSTGSSALAQQACVEVQRSLNTYAASLRAHDPATASRERSRALAELRAALRPAALASTSGGQWQALAATLSESNRVPESNLVTALSDQCSGNG